MSLYKRGKSYQCRLVVGGVKYQKSLGAVSELEAEAAQAAWRVELDKGITPLGKSPTVGEFGTRFLNYLPSRVAPGSFRLYTTSWMHIARSPLATLRLDEITRAVVDKFADDKLASGLAVITTNSILRTLRRALFLAYRWELRTKEPRGVVALLPNENKREFVLSDTDEARIVAKFGQHSLMRQIVPFACDTGLRASEIAALEWRDVDLTDSPVVRVREGKTKFARRTVPLTQRTAASLRLLFAARTECAHVFTRYEGRHPITAGWMSTRFKAAIRALGISEDCVFHNLRHTCATRLGAAGASAFEIQRLMGHSSISISQRYVHPDARQLQAAVARLGK
jgi:integrase